MIALITSSRNRTGHSPNSLRMIAPLWATCSATLAAACPRSIQSGLGSLADQVALELGQVAEHFKDRLTATRSRVDGFVKALQPDTHFLQRFGAGDKVLQGSPQPAQPPYDQRVAIAQLLQGAVQARALGPGAACLVLENPLTPERLQCVMLQVEVLFIL